MMKTIELLAEHMKGKVRVHHYLKKMMEFPEYYGENLDALHDCLTDIHETTEVYLPSMSDMEAVLGEYGVKVVHVFKAAGEKNRHLEVHQRRHNTITE